MPRKRIETKIKNFGLYTKWDRNSKELPRILDFTTRVPAKLDVEFGYILNIKKAKGSKLTFRIDHPPFKNSDGEISPPFEDELHIPSNDYNFFLGDTVWEPVEDKKGLWTLTIWVDDKQAAQKTFELY